jgi:hypothetical protein
MENLSVPMFSKSRCWWLVRSKGSVQDASCEGRTRDRKEGKSKLSDQNKLALSLTFSKSESGLLKIHDTKKNLFLLGMNARNYN